MSNKVDAITSILNDEHFQAVVKELQENQLQRIIYSNADQTDELMSYLESIAKTSDIKSKAWKIF
jgi:ATP-dependent RNA circularization protein (DNA/RNA ligase family)